MANYDYGHDHNVSGTTTLNSVDWSGLAAYIKYAPSAKYYLAFRGEYFNDNQGFSTGVNNLDLKSFTGTFQRVLSKSLITRLEVRYDTANQGVFEDHANGFTSKNQTTATLGLIYAFTTAQ